MSPSANVSSVAMAAIVAGGITAYYATPPIFRSEVGSTNAVQVWYLALGVVFGIYVPGISIIQTIDRKLGELGESRRS